MNNLNLSKKQKAFLKEVNMQTFFEKKEYADFTIGYDFSKATVSSLVKRGIIEIVRSRPNHIFKNYFNYTVRFKKN